MAGRREVPVDPREGPVQRFAFELRKLHSEAGGVTYRVLAQRAGYSITTLSQAAGGEMLPTLPVVLAYAMACGGDPVQWEARWKQAVDEVAASDPTTAIPADCAGTRFISSALHTDSLLEAVLRVRGTGTRPTGHGPVTRPDLVFPAGRHGNRLLQALVARLVRIRSGNRDFLDSWCAIQGLSRTTSCRELIREVRLCAARWSVMSGTRPTGYGRTWLTTSATGWSVGRRNVHSIFPRPQ